MKTINYLQDKFVVIGAGETGRSIIDYLGFRQARILRVLDTRANPPPLTAWPTVIGGDLEFKNICDADIVVISPGVSIYETVLQKAMRQGILVVGDIELFAQAIRNWSAQVIGVSGSNGKTTVTSLCGFLAAESGIKTLVAGNIGKPVLAALLAIEQGNPTQANPESGYPELIVLELSSFQLETTYSLQLSSATVLNLSEDHLDRYRDLLEYAYVKAHIFNNCRLQVLNGDDPLVMAMARGNLAQVCFGERATCGYQLTHDVVANQDVLTVAGQTFIATDQLRLMGRHNYLNCLASLALLGGAGYDLLQFKDGLRRFAGLEHRMQKVAEHGGIVYIEDSKGTNVGAVIAGVSGIDRPVHLILGGDGKGQDFTPLRELVSRKCKSVALIGRDAAVLSQVLAGLANICLYPSLEEAVAGLVANAEAGDAVILSPACASWDMFSNYKQRAQVFVDSVYANIKKSR